MTMILPCQSAVMLWFLMMIPRISSWPSQLGSRPSSIATLAFGESSTCHPHFTLRSKWEHRHHYYFPSNYDPGRDRWNKRWTRRSPPLWAALAPPSHSDNKSTLTRWQSVRGLISWRDVWRPRFTSTTHNRPTSHPHDLDDYDERALSPHRQPEFVTLAPNATVHDIHTHFMTLALKQAREAALEGEVPIGALVVMPTSTWTQFSPLPGPSSTPTPETLSSRLTSPRRLLARLFSWLASYFLPNRNRGRRENHAYLDSYAQASHIIAPTISREELDGPASPTHECESISSNPQNSTGLVPGCGEGEHGDAQHHHYQENRSSFVILAAAHNQVEQLHDASAHAELLALRQAAQVVGNWRLSRPISRHQAGSSQVPNILKAAGATLYSTLEPCPMCLSAALAFRVQHVVYGAPDLRLGAVQSYMHLLTDHVHPYHRIATVTAGLQGMEAAQLMRDFFRQQRQQRSAQHGSEKECDESMPPS